MISVMPDASGVAPTLQAVSGLPPGVLAGAALLPDLDYPTSTATRSAGPVTAVLCRVVRAASSTVWRATRTPADDGGYSDGTGVHRHLTHTLPAAAVCWSGAPVVALMLAA
ncbi:metal-dependent hydrolase [Nocardiopsis rhodophaea]